MNNPEKEKSELVKEYLSLEPPVDTELANLLRHAQSQEYKDKVSMCEEAERQIGMKYALIFGVGAIVFSIIAMPVIVYIQKWPMPSVLMIAIALLVNGTMGAIFGNTWGRTRLD